MHTTHARPLIVFLPAVLLTSAFACSAFASPNTSDQGQGFVRFTSPQALHAFLKTHPGASQIHPALLWVKWDLHSLRYLTAAENADKIGLDVETFEPERTYRIPQVERQSAEIKAQLWGVSKIGAEKAWTRTKGDPSILVAVLDTGIDYSHKALKSRMAANALELNGTPGIDDDSNGYVDDVYGYDFFNTDADPIDDEGHGSHVAGTIAGFAPQDDFYGVAPDASLLAVKTHNRSGEGKEESVVKGILYAADRGAKVLNCSWGGAPEAPGHSKLLMDAIAYAGTKGALLVAAAGNDGANNDKVDSYPANYDLPNVISVASTTKRDSLSGFSNFGLKKVHLGAPGSGIYSVDARGNYTVSSGTSMAAPHVAGAAALVFAAFQSDSLTPEQVRQKLMESVTPVSGLEGRTVTGGRVSVEFLATPRSPL